MGTPIGPIGVKAERRRPTLRMTSGGKREGAVVYAVSRPQRPNQGGIALSRVRDFLSLCLNRLPHSDAHTHLLPLRPRRAHECRISFVLPAGLPITARSATSHPHRSRLNTRGSTQDDV